MKNHELNATDRALYSQSGSDATEVNGTHRSTWESSHGATRAFERQRQRASRFPGAYDPALAHLISALHAAADAQEPGLVTEALNVAILAARVSARLPAAIRPDPLVVLAAGHLSFVDPRLLRTGRLRPYAVYVEDLAVARAHMKCPRTTIASLLSVAERFLALTTADDPRTMPTFAEVIAELRSAPERFDSLVVTALKRTMMQPNGLQSAPRRSSRLLKAAA